MLTDERKAAVRTALRKIAKLQAARKCPPEFKPGATVVIALDDELTADVLARVTSYSPPVMLAVYFPESERLELVTLNPSQRSEQAPEEDLVKAKRNSTIGMVVDAGTRIRVPQQWDEVYEAHKVDMVSA